MQTTYTGIGESLLFILILSIILTIVCFFARRITRKPSTKTVITREKREEEKIRIREDKIQSVIPKTLRVDNYEDFVMKACEYYGRHLVKNREQER